MTTNMPVEFSMDFALSDYVPRPFADVVADLGVRANEEGAPPVPQQ